MKNYIYSVEGNSPKEAASKLLHTLRKNLPLNTKIAVYGGFVHLTKRPKNGHLLLKHIHKKGNNFECSISINIELFKYLL